jgi:transcriptional regulator with XRE-family HTH domain
MDEIRKQLKSARKAKHLSQQDVGKKLGLPQSHISTIESGKVEPVLKTVITMARVLDLELMLIPRRLIPAVRTLLSGKQQEPLWKIDTDEENENGY